MAKLTVQAVRSGDSPYDFSGLAPADICVSVTDEQGMPVVELTPDNFRLTIFDPDFFSLVKASPVPFEIEQVHTVGLGPGFYRLWLRPSSEVDWANSDIVSLGIAVERRRLGPSEGGRVIPPPLTDNGQTVIALDVVEAEGA